MCEIYQVPVIIHCILLCSVTKDTAYTWDKCIIMLFVSAKWLLPPLLPPTVQSKAINPIISNTDISPSSHPRTAAHTPAAFMHLQSHTAAAHAAIQFNIFVSYCQQQHLKYKPHSTKV